MERVTADDLLRYAHFQRNTAHFVQEVLAASVIEQADYVPGTQRIEFYETLLTPGQIVVFDARRSSNNPFTGSYEEALYQRVSETASGTLILIGGLGSGKSTVVRVLRGMIAEREEDINSTFACECAPCRRRPLVIDAIDVSLDVPSHDLTLEVLLRLRRALYEAIIDEWLTVHEVDPASVPLNTRKTLRRLLISNDVYQWSDAETAAFDPHLRSPDLELPEPLLSRSPNDWDLRTLDRQFGRAASSLDIALSNTTRGVPASKRFAALLLAFWLRRCNPKSPRNLIVIDNLDPQPTESIDQVLRVLHDLSESGGGRFLVPLRPSSIVPEGFAYTPAYMYHYGPNCFEMILRRLHRHVLSRSRAEVAATAFARTPSPDEVSCFLTATYLYAGLCTAGLELTGEPRDTAPPFHPDHAFLHSVALPSGALRRLATTVAAIVGSSGRYATSHLVRFFASVYSQPSFLKSVEGAPLQAMTAVRVYYGPLIRAVFGVGSDEISAPGLVNLYSPTESNTNADLPTMSKMRILAFLARRSRTRVSEVVRELARYGIPLEVSIDALNYLHAKTRLLVWFSRNSQLSKERQDFDQYVVISEQGRASFAHLARDFDYLWFCGQQIGGHSERVDASFAARLDEYRRLIVNVARTDWKQMTFLRCASGATWGSAPGSTAEDMLSLPILYSSFAAAMSNASRALQSSTEVSRESTTIRELARQLLDQQNEYELYNGERGYLQRHAAEIDEARGPVADVLSIDGFSDAHEPLVELLKSWAPSETAQAPDLTVPPRPTEEMWTEVAWGLPLTVVRPESTRARDALATALKPVLRRRLSFGNLIGTRFPAFSVVRHNVALFINELVFAADTARTISPSPLHERIGAEIDAFRSIQRQLDDNAYSVGDHVTRDEMDVLKKRANAISDAFVAIAQRLEAPNIAHLSVYWSV